MPLTEAEVEALIAVGNYETAMAAMAGPPPRPRARTTMTSGTTTSWPG